MTTTRIPTEPGQYWVRNAIGSWLIADLVSPSRRLVLLQGASGFCSAPDEWIWNPERIKSPDEIQAVKIEVLGLRTLTTNRLKSKGLATVEAVRSADRLTLSSIPGIGRKGVKDIQDAVRLYDALS